MALITGRLVFSPGGTIYSADQNTNHGTIWNEFNGNISNTNIASAAGIVDTKLAQITTSGKVSGAALTTLGSTPTGAGTLPSKNGGTGGDLSAITVGGVPYFSATGVMSALAAGTSGQLATSGGAGALTWSNFLSSILDYGTSASSSTAKTAPNLKIAYGEIATVTGGSSTSITNLPFSSTASYVIIVCETAGSGSDESRGSVGVTKSSASAASVYNTDNADHGVYWFAVGT